jgi:hypothetical protein
MQFYSILIQITDFLKNNNIYIYIYIYTYIYIYIYICIYIYIYIWKVPTCFNTFVGQIGIPCWLQHGPMAPNGPSMGGEIRDPMLAPFSAHCSIMGPLWVPWWAASALFCPCDSSREGATCANTRHTFVKGPYCYRLEFSNSLKVRYQIYNRRSRKTRLKYECS